MTDLGDIAQAVLPFLVSAAVLAVIGLWTGRQQRRVHERNRRGR